MSRKFRVNEKVRKSPPEFTKEKKCIGKVLEFDDNAFCNGCYKIRPKGSFDLLMFHGSWLDDVHEDTPVDDLRTILEKAEKTNIEKLDETPIMFQKSWLDEVYEDTLVDDLHTILGKTEEPKSDYHKAKYDKGKYQPRYIPVIAEELAARVFEFGGCKNYGFFSFQDVPEAMDRYMDALKRHYDVLMLHKQQNGNYDINESESQIPEIAFILSNAMMLVHVYVREAAKAKGMTMREYVDKEINPGMFTAFDAVKEKYNTKS